MISIFVFSLCLLYVTAYIDNYVSFVRQDDYNFGIVEALDGSGYVCSKDSTSVNFTFQWPYVQMTNDNDRNQIYTLVIPSNESIPTTIYQQHPYVVGSYPYYSIYYSLIQKWTIPQDGNLVIFDLQYSTKKQTFFGIKVTGPYLRTFSNIIFGPEETDVNTVELYSLPENWFVNASTYYPAGDIYFALVNNFPGHNYSTRDQQLAVLNFSQVIVGSDAVKPDTQLLPILPSSGVYLGQLQFISFSPEVKILFGAGINLETNEAYIVTIDPKTGLTSDRLCTIKNIQLIGPLVTHSNHGTTGVPLTWFVREGPNTWHVYSLQYNTNAKYVNVLIRSSTYVGTNYKYIAAAVRSLDEY